MNTMKIWRWISDNVLFIATLFLLAFIPLYPKLPIVNVEHTWVYIRAEDFIVVFVLLLWVILLVRQKITLKTPLTLPIILFWIIGAIATMHGILLIFPTISDVFSNVAFLSYLRRIEYLSMFFVAYSGVKDKRCISYVITILAITLLLVVGYGFGQKLFGFPAFLTMNEEFAKGIPIRLSQLSRVSSTFGGHYDLAAYLVLILPLLASMIFGFRTWFVKLFFLLTVSVGLGLLFMTVSRVSFFVLLISLVIVLIFQKKKLVILALLGIALLLLSFSSSLLDRFGNTIKDVDVLVAVNTGEAIGQIKDVPADTFKGKTIKVKFAQSKREIDAGWDDPKLATASALIVPFSELPPLVPLLVESNAPTGENLPQGTQYVNLPLSPVTKKLGNFLYQKSKDSATDTAVLDIHGDFLVKRAKAFDLSFTTRSQGEWPRAIAAFKRNILLGSGYGSVSLAVDNNYLRILSEVGLLGFFSFFGIFFITGIYIKKIWPEVDSQLVKSFVIGFIAGVIGLALNALLIDVFEASKIAFLLWLLMGITVGVLRLYQKRSIDFYAEIRKLVTSSYAITVLLFVFTMVAFSSMLDYYFVGDDFTWLRWIADCNSTTQQCPSVINTVFHYFTDSNGFFYRPGTKIYFLLMYSVFWLNQAAYHIVSILLHFIVSLLVFFLAKKIIKSAFSATLAACLFLILSGYSEAVFWISSTGFLFNAIFILLSLLFFIVWKEKKKNVYFILSVISIVFSLLFHELGVVAPFIVLLYEYIYEENFKDKLFKNVYPSILLLPILPYLGLRFISQSHWLNGDYSYNLLKLPYNIIGNAIGYFMLDLSGPASLSVYQTFRNFSKGHVLVSILVFPIIAYILYLGYRMIYKKMEKDEQKIIIFGFLFFITALLPFLGLGNIASRYSYLSSVGFILLFVFFLKKLHRYLLSNGQYVALASIVTIACIFCLAQIIQLQKIHSDWYEAGEKSKNFFLSIDKVYANYLTSKDMQFYFVNVPIRHGEAWIFPVGLSDALWFTFQNQNITAYTAQSLDLAFSDAKGSRDPHIFYFDENGRVTEVIRTETAAIIVPDRKK